MSLYKRGWKCNRKILFSIELGGCEAYHGMWGAKFKAAMVFCQFWKGDNDHQISRRNIHLITQRNTQQITHFSIHQITHGCTHQQISIITCALVSYGITQIRPTLTQR